MITELQKQEENWPFKSQQSCIMNIFYLRDLDIRDIDSVFCQHAQVLKSLKSILLLSFPQKSMNYSLSIIKLAFHID